MVSDDGMPLAPSQAPARHVLDRGTALPPSTYGFQRDDGTLRWLRIQAQPLLDPHGRVHGVALSLQPFSTHEGFGRAERA